MPRLLKMLLVASLLAVVPLRAMTAVTGDLCPQVHQAVQADPSHCPGGVALVAATRPALAPSVPSLVSAVERGVAAFIPEQPDPPPLALR